MNFNLVFELITDPASTYLAQASLGFLMFLVFRHFSLIYIRRFLRSWARGWLAFSVQMMATVVLMTEPAENLWPVAVRVPLEFIAQAGAFLHIIFILLGAYQLVLNKPANRRLYHLILIFSIILAIVTSTIYSLDELTQVQYHLLRIGSRCLISGVGFLLAAYIVWRHPKFTRGLGQRLLFLSFLVFSAYQFFYLLLILFNFPDEQTFTPGSRGLINLMMMAVMSMSMVIWLLEDEREKLHKANKDLDSFLYSTSHDLRAPISSILGLTYLGKVELQEEKGRHYMDLIEQRVKKLNMILTDILRLSKTKKLEIRNEAIDFNDLLKETMEDIQFNKGTSNIRLVYEPRPENICYTDKSQLGIVLANLISNAVKYHRLNQDDPYISISFQRSGPRVTIQVEDNGQGIPAQSLGKIFDMFFRANQETEGTGLGLYIVKEALEKIKGKIDVDSTFGKGTRFTIQLDNA